MDSLLALEELRTHFFTAAGVVKAVDGVSLKVPKGGRLGIVGESGCGKSVTALSILRLVPPPGRIAGGKVLLAHSSSLVAGSRNHEPRVTSHEPGMVDLLTLQEPQMRQIRGGRIAIIFQETMTSLNPVFTIGNQIEEAMILHQRLSRSERKERLLESLREVGIPDPPRVAVSYPHELSGGMRQRAMIAMALSCRPDLLIADEPTTALDVTVQAQVLALLRELQERLKMALILITHDLGIIAETVDDVAVMYAGRIVEQGTTPVIFEGPGHPYTAALLRSLPSWEKGGPLASIPGSVPDLARLPVGCSFQERCERVQERCRREEPPLEERAAGDRVRCFFPYD